MLGELGWVREVTLNIFDELGELGWVRAVMLDEFGTEIENAESKLDATMRKMVNLSFYPPRTMWINS